MKGTDHFKRTIYMYLEQRAEEDALFAKKYRNPAKNMDECVTHILNYVQKSGSHRSKGNASRSTRASVIRSSSWSQRPASCATTRLS